MADDKKQVYFVEGNDLNADSDYGYFSIGYYSTMEKAEQAALDYAKNTLKYKEEELVWDKPERNEEGKVNVAKELRDVGNENFIIYIEAYPLDEKVR